MRLLKLGVYDAVHGVTTYVAQDSPAIEGADLAGVIQDLQVYRQANEAYRGVLEREFEEKYGAKLLMIYGWPSQQLWCNLGDKSIKTYGLDKLKVRRFVPIARHSVTSSKALAAARLRLHLPRSFGLQKGVADCGLTGTLPAYNAKWWQVVTHNIRIRLGYASSFLAFNLKTWNSLDDETKALFKRELPKLEEEMWVATAKNDQRGMDCNASGPCMRF